MQRSIGGYRVKLRGIRRRQRQNDRMCLMKRQNVEIIKVSFMFRNMIESQKKKQTEGKELKMTTDSALYNS